MNEFECIRQETCSSQEPEMIYDVAIIGAGPGGIFSALELTQQAPELKRRTGKRQRPQGTPVSHRR